MGRPIINLVGREFGRLIVKELVGPDDSGNILWRCECTCGNFLVTRGTRLKSGGVKSCGCLRWEVSKYGEHHKLTRKEGTAFRALLAQYKENARNRDICWELTEEQFRKLTSSPCYYTGTKPEMAKRTRSLSEDVYLYNGIDRVDNAQGYTIENCVSCCFDINSMKSTFSKDHFIELCSKVAERFKNVVTNN
jgi:hypothetical protein